MKIKFLRPVAGFAYFENDIAETLPEAKAAALVVAGHAIIIHDTEGPVNGLPEDLPAREILFAEGLETLTDVKNAMLTLIDIKGIGKKLAANIKDFLSSKLKANS